MNTVTLRARFLIALGIPATGVALVGASCKPSDPIAPDGSGPSGTGTAVAPTTATATATGTSLPVAVDEPRPGECGVDEARESVCGVMNSFEAAAPAPFDKCGTRGSDLEAYHSMKIVEPTPGMGSAKDASLRSFAFDKDATAAWSSEYFGKLTNGNTPWKAACCYARCAKVEVVRPPPRSTEANMVAQQRCIPKLSRTTLPAAADSRCAAAVRVRVNGNVRDATFSAVRDDLCCYTTLIKAAPCVGGQLGPNGECHMHPRGRPLRDADEGLVLAPAWTRADWGGEATGFDRRPGAREAAAAWARDAAAEHASVASFARLSLQLLALGAPADLLARCHRAALDEVEHARLAYGIAARFSGEPVGPGPLAVEAAGLAVDLATLIDETIRDGCVGETAASLEAALAQGSATDSGVAEALDVIARDEASHAELAFAIVRWAVAIGGEAVRARVLDHADRLERERARDAPPDAFDLAAFGRVGARAMEELRVSAAREVAAPCLRAIATTDRTWSLHEAALSAAQRLW